jgi:hypothetical protein
LTVAFGYGFMKFQTDSKQKPIQIWIQKNIDLPFVRWDYFKLEKRGGCDQPRPLPSRAYTIRRRIPVNPVGIRMSRGANLPVSLLTASKKPNQEQASPAL